MNVAQEEACSSSADIHPALHPPSVLVVLMCWMCRWRGQVLDLFASGAQGEPTLSTRVGVGDIAGVALLSFNEANTIWAYARLLYVDKPLCGPTTHQFDSMLVPVSPMFSVGLRSKLQAPHEPVNRFGRCNRRFRHEPLRRLRFTEPN